MKNLSPFFRRSQALGLAYELVSYGFLLLCGYLLSNLLSLAMVGAWREMYKKAALTAAALALAVGPKFALGFWRSNAKLTDTQHFRDFLYRCVIDRRVQVADRGDMEVRLNSNVETIEKYFQQTCPKAISGSLVMFCSTALLCLVDWRIGLIFFVLDLTQLLPILVYEKWARQIYNQTHSDEEAYCNWLLEGYGGIRTIKAYGLETWYMERFNNLNQAIVTSGRRAEQVGTVENIIFASVDSLLQYGSYGMIGMFVLFGGLSIEKTPLLLILAGYLFSSISSVFELRLQQFDCQQAVKRLGFRETQQHSERGQSLLTVRNVVKSFGDKQVLRGASCEIRAGDRVLLKGDNGSGKSTLLRVIMGIETADSGAVRFGIPKSDCAFSLQEEPALPIPGRELAGAMVEKSYVNRQTLTKYFHGFHIQDLLSKPISELSPGERKKFYLSAALARNNRLLILDEPTNHLDRDSICYLNSQLRAYPGTLLVCTHAGDLDLPWNRVIHMEGGVCNER